MTGIHSVAEDKAGDVELATNQDAARDPLLYCLWMKLF